MELILNKDDDSNHLQTIIEQLQSSDEAYIAIAFFKKSGLEQIKDEVIKFLNRGGKIVIVAGQNFGLTEPQALHSIRNLISGYKKSKLFLAKTNSANQVFHPKLYLFRREKSCVLILGSANLTKGGLSSNQEASVLLSCHSRDNIWREAQLYFSQLTSEDFSDEATLLVIKKYETFYNLQKKHNKNSAAVPPKNASQTNFNYKNLSTFYKGFNTTDREFYYKEKLADYKEAKVVLDQIADASRLTQKQFETFLDRLVARNEDKKRLWHSGSLFRLRRKVYPHYKEFQQLVRYIRKSKYKSPEVVFDGSKKKVEQIRGAGVNYVTEIMMTYNYRSFANLNQNPLTVLKNEGGVHLKSQSSSFNGKDYEEYCELVQEITSKLELRNMLEADSFFNHIYWSIID